MAKVKEATLNAASVFEGTKKALQNIRLKEVGVKSGENERISALKKSEILEALDKVNTAREQNELEDQLKQIEIDRKKDFERAYFAQFLSVEEKREVEQTYQAELKAANELLENALENYKNVSFDISASIEVLEELLNLYSNLAYAKEIEYRLDEEKDQERKKFLNLSLNHPYLSKVESIKNQLKEAKGYEKKQKSFDQELFKNITA